MKIHHFGYLVKSIEKARDTFFALGFEECPAPLGGITFDEYRQINISFIQKDGYCIELIMPASKESGFYPLLKKYKNSAYHICYETADREADVRDLEEGGWSVIAPPAPAPAMGGHEVCFLMHPSIGIIELVDIS